MELSYRANQFKRLVSLHIIILLKLLEFGAGLS